jgi:hypothetical protein
MQDEELKPWYLSKGFVGPLVTAVLMALRNFGIIDLDSDATLAAFYQMVEFGGVVIGAYGRATATRQLRVLS